MPDSLENVRRSRKPDSSRVRNITDKRDAVSTDAVEESDGMEFHHILKGVSGGSAEKRLDAIMADIRRLSGLLAHRRLLEDLEDYRSRVGDFLKICMDEVLSIKETGKRRGSRRKHLLVVKNVNIELEELSRLVLGDAPDFKIVKELNTIEGLLLDLYR